MSSENLKTVELRRSVRIGRLVIGGAIVGALVGSLLAVLFPVADGALYSVGQIAGFMILVGGAAGLLLGSLLALILSNVAKRQHGTGVVSQVFEEVEDGAGAGAETEVAPGAGAAAVPSAE